MTEWHWRGAFMVGEGNQPMNRCSVPRRGVSESPTEQADARKISRSKLFLNI